MRRNKWLLFLPLLLFLGSCHRLSPQAQGRLDTQEESEELSEEILLNMSRADSANDMCLEYVAERKDSSFVLSDMGFWYSITKRNESPRLSKGACVELLYESCFASGEMIESVQTATCVGNQETLLAIDLLLPNMAPGEEAIIVAPYYLAYGREGTDRVPPFTGCIVINLTNIYYCNE